ncbi:MAG: DUF4286 family protein [Petrimonas sp.]|jgi:hypothetical protein|nr:MAG: hypothetical protein BWZ00_01279 [Bacteroidetes bacterium ADurb.BinA174]
MIIYNTTFSIPKELQNEFLDFIRDEYIPLSTKNNLIKEPRLTRVFSKDDDEDYSFALEFKADTIEQLEEWNKMYGRKLYFLVMRKFKQHILGFTTLLQPIEL